MKTRVSRKQFRQELHRVASIAIAAMMVLLPATLFAGDSIVAVHENGRVVFVNNDALAMQPDGVSNTPTVHKRLVYWSNVEHRWKRAHVLILHFQARSRRHLGLLAQLADLHSQFDADPKRPICSYCCRAVATPARDGVDPSH